MLHCNIRFSAVRKSFLLEVALQQVKLAVQKLRCKSGAFLPLSCGFQARTFRLPRLGPAEMQDPPAYRAIPFRDSIAEGGIARILPCFAGYRGSIAEIPPLLGGIAPPLFMLSKGETLRKGGGVSHPIGHVETPRTPIARNRGVSLR